MAATGAMATAAGATESSAPVLTSGALTSRCHRYKSCEYQSRYASCMLHEKSLPLADSVLLGSCDFHCCEFSSRIIQGQLEGPTGPSFWILNRVKREREANGDAENEKAAGQRPRGPAVGAQRGGAASGNQGCARQAQEAGEAQEEVGGGRAIALRVLR